MFYRMRLLLAAFFLMLLMSSLVFAESVDLPPVRPTPVLQTFLGKYISTPSLQFSVFSYKPVLGSLVELLQSVGVSEIPSALLPTFALVFEHTSELDSRLEIGYWQMDLHIPPPTSATLSTTLVPISYQLIYRPVLLSEFLPIYLGGGIGLLGAHFGGNAVDLVESLGIAFDGGSSGATGYVIIGTELFRWENNLSLNFEMKRILKTVETTGTLPLNIILDGTAIGLGVKMRF